MKNLCVVFLIGFVLSQAMSFRIRRQGGEGNRNNQPTTTKPVTTTTTSSQTNKQPATTKPVTTTTASNQTTKPGQQSNTTTAATTTTAPPSVGPNSLGIRECIRLCPKTPEYNPVCGSDNVTYDNPSFLNCAAMACGVNVTVTRRARCP